MVQIYLPIVNTSSIAQTAIAGPALKGFDKTFIMFQIICDWLLFIAKILNKLNLMMRWSNVEPFTAPFTNPKIIKNTFKPQTPKAAIDRSMV